MKKLKRCCICGSHKNEDGTLEVSAGGIVSHGGRMLEGQLAVRPYGTNVVRILRDAYEPPPKTAR